MKLRFNLVAGIANSTWSALIRLAVIPLYVKYLGIESYGLIVFLTAMQGLLQIFDFGLALTLNREVARCLALGDFLKARQLLHSLAVIYWVLAGFIASLIVASAPLIASTWLGASTLPKGGVVTAVMLIGVVIGSSWPLGLYQGALIGAQRIVSLSCLNILMVTISSLGAVVVIARTSPTIQAFFAWQVAIGLLSVIVTRHAAWRVLGREGRGHFDLTALRSIWRFSAGVTGIAITAIVLMQTDKILLSRILSLVDFGRYTLAALAASALYVYLTPVFNVLYPRLSALVALGDLARVAAFYRSGTRLFLSIHFPIAIAGVTLSGDVLRMWTGDTVLSNAIAPTVSLLLVGTTLNGIMHFPYAIQLAYGNTRLPIAVNLTLIAIMFPMTIALAISYGGIGGAAAWAILNLIYVGLGSWLTHRTILPGLALGWLLGDVGIPLVISLSVVGIGAWVIRAVNLSSLDRLVGAVGLCAIAFAAVILASPELRPARLRGIL
jgi:O-antigen/teichoic acid export membrane protein